MGISFTEFLKPITQVKEMFQKFGKGDVLGGIKDYIESVPGIVLIGKGAGALIPVILKPSLAKGAQAGVAAAVKWYLAPMAAAKTVGYGAVKSTTAVAVGSKVATTVPIVAGLAIGAVIQNELTKRSEHGISYIDLGKAIITGKPSDEMNAKLDTTSSKDRWIDYGLGIISPWINVVRGRPGFWSTLLADILWNKRRESD